METEVANAMGIVKSSKFSGSIETYLNLQGMEGGRKEERREKERGWYLKFLWNFKILWRLTAFKWTFKNQLGFIGLISNYISFIINNIPWLNSTQGIVQSLNITRSCATWVCENDTCALDFHIWYKDLLPNFHPVNHGKFIATAHFH